MSQSQRYQKKLQPTYYVDHFNRIINFYTDVYKTGFSEDIDELVELYQKFTISEKCVFIRAANKKNPLIMAEDFLKYQEIKSSIETFENMYARGIFRRLNEYDKDLFINSATKTQMQAVLDNAGMSYKKSSDRGRLQEIIASTPSTEPLFPEYLFRLTYSRTYEKLLFSYFGRANESLTAFALGDMGLRQTGQFKLTARRKFISEDQLNSEFFFADLKAQLKQKKLKNFRLPPHTFKPEIWPSPQSKKSSERFNQCLTQLSEIESIEDQRKDEILKLATGSPARIKRARLLKKQGRKDELKAYLEEIILDPTDDIELFEASELLDLSFKLKKKTSTTELLSRAETLWLDESYRNSVEYGVKVSLTEKNLVVDRSENELWLALFGTLFWDLLFGEKSKSMSNDFDRIPKSLLDGDFYKEHHIIIEERLSELFSDKIQKIIFKNYTQGYGKKNSLFHWRKSLFDKINRVLKVSSSATTNTLRRLAQDYTSNKTGFPDLINYLNEQLELIEVKGPGDVIRKNQIVQMRKLQEDGHIVKVLKVHFKVDPDQTYTVVDVETTGGRANTHRVTEIGAVKIKNGKIVDEFHSLINPQRAIPKNIVRLTGITDQMVKNAPLFTEIADDFKKFLEGSVFAAHHVNFDYGFIKEEYARLMVNFRMPKFCTCAEARKYLKGPKRYGLAYLCEYYNIDLENHHRALDDAKAASEILLLINKEREQENQE